MLLLQTASASKPLQSQFLSLFKTLGKRYFPDKCEVIWMPT